MPGYVYPIVSDSEQEFDITIDINDGIIVNDFVLGSAPFVVSGPQQFQDGLWGKSFLVEKGATNLVVDPSFERGDLTHWTANTVTAAIDSTIASHGKNSIKVTSAGTGTSHYIHNAAYIPVSPSTLYLAGASVWFDELVAGTGNSSAVSRLHIVTRDAGGAAVGGYAYDLGTRDIDDWAKLLVSFTTEPTSTQVEIRLHNYDQGDMWFDNVFLKQIVVGT